jgi:hypothetical protein
MELWSQEIKWKIEVFGNHLINLKLRLYPIIVPNPRLTYKMLNKRGVDAYIGVT